MRPSWPERPPLLVISQSARALVTAASSAGFRCHSIDGFADLDTRERSVQSTTAPFTEAGNFDAPALLAAVDRLDPERRCEILYGSGFEDEPSVLGVLAQQRRVHGNSPLTIAAVKNPQQLATSLANLAIPHPVIRLDPPDSPGWIIKHQGGCGGRHIQHWRAHNPTPKIHSSNYWQRWQPGCCLSATVISGTRSALITGYARQWQQRRGAYPFTFSGAISVARSQLPPAVLHATINAASALSEHFSLRGLWGFDFIVAKGRWWLLEINPRPPASFELHSNPAELLRAHFQPEQGASCSLTETVAGQRIIYAPRATTLGRIAWPTWTSDRPPAGTRIGPNEPLCTVHARAASSQLTLRILLNYKKSLLAGLKLQRKPGNRN